MGSLDSWGAALPGLAQLFYAVPLWLLFDSLGKDQIARGMLRFGVVLFLANFAWCAGVWIMFSQMRAP